MRETKAQEKIGEANKTAIGNYKGAAEAGQRGRQLGNKKKRKPNQSLHKRKEEEMAVVTAARGGQEKPLLKKINS